MDTGQSWEPAVWYQAFQNSYKDILNISLMKANIKLITRWYYVPSRLARIYPEASPLCFKGCDLEGTMFHICWSCPRIRSYWKKVLHTLRKITGSTVSPDSTIALLNRKIPSTSSTLQALTFLLEAKITLAWAWKTPSVSFRGAMRKMSWVMAQEQLVAKLQYKRGKFEVIWVPFPLPDVKS